MSINTATGTVWINENDRVICLSHGGHYLQSAVKNGAGLEVSTPLDHWTRFTSDEAVEHGLICEDCQFYGEPTSSPDPQTEGTRK